MMAVAIAKPDLLGTAPAVYPFSPRVVLLVVAESFHDTTEIEPRVQHPETWY